MARHTPTGCKGSKYDKSASFGIVLSFYVYIFGGFTTYLCEPVRVRGVICRLERMQQSHHVNRSLHATFRLVIFSCKIVESKLI